MIPMFNLLHAEWYQLRRNSAYRGLLSVVCSAGMVFAVLSLVAPEQSFAVGDGRQALQDSMGHAVFIGLFLAFLAGKTLGADFNNHTICLQAALGNSRIRLVVVKTLVFLVSALPVILLYPLVNSVILTAVRGWGEAIDAETLVNLLRVTGLNVLAYLWICSVYAALCIRLRDTGMAMGGAVAYYILCLVLAEDWSGVPVLQKTSPLYWLVAFRDGAAREVGMEFLGYASAFVLLSVVLSYVSFRRVDLK